MKVGFVGAGNMAGAIARGWAAAGDSGPDTMLFCDLDRERAADLATEVGGETREGLGELAAETDVLLLAVKPNALEDVAKELGGSAPALISVMAATPLARIAETFPGVPAIRVMPNQPVEVRRGILCLAAPADLEERLKTHLVGLLLPLGRLVPIEERLIDAGMAIMSCSPAYVALFAESLAEAGVREGLDRELALELVAGTLAGTAELLALHEPVEIRRRVAPPGGATEAGLEALERGGFPAAVSAAVDASLERFR
jgi:pyrroline-5-carboxylate reductase